MKGKILLTVAACLLLLSGAPTVTSTPGEVTGPGQFPPEPGLDDFPVSLAQIGIDLTLNGIPDGEISAEGPFVVERGAPVRGSDGRRSIETEILQMDLSGSSPLGPVTIRQHPQRPSVGRITARDAEQDFPADSFFDIFVEINIGGQIFVNPEPIRMEAVITEIPPKITVYRSFRDPLIPLFNLQNQLAALLLHVAHAPNPDLPIEPRDLKVLIERVQLRLELVSKKVDLLNRNLPLGHVSHLVFPFNVSGGALETGVAISNITAQFEDFAQGEGSSGNIVFRIYPQDNPSALLQVTTQQLSQQGLGTGANAAGIIPAGGTYTILVRELLQGVGRSGPFTGQVAAWCGFPQAQGINFIADNQFSTQAQGYPAVIIK